MTDSTFKVDPKLVMFRVLTAIFMILVIIPITSLHKVDNEAKVVNKFMLKIDPNLLMPSFCCMSLDFLWFFVMAAIQDGQHHVEVEDCSKLSSAQFLLQFCMLTSRVIVATLWFLVIMLTPAGSEHDPNLVVFNLVYLEQWSQSRYFCDCW